MADKASFAKIQEWIPGLTKYCYIMARQHILLHGRGTPVPSQSPRTRMVVPQEKLAHFLDFITSPHIIQDLPFGEKVLSLSTKEVIKIPNVVRNMIPERIVQQYQAYSKEEKLHSSESQYSSASSPSMPCFHSKIITGNTLH